MAVDGEGRFRWEDAKEVARIRAEEEATRKAEERLYGGRGYVGC